MRPLLSLYLLLGWISGTALVLFNQSQPATVAQADDLRHLLQNSPSGMDQVRMLLQLSTFYLGKTLDRTSSLDSALVLARQAKALSLRLNFAKEWEEAHFLEGSAQIRKQNNRAVRQLLESGSDTARIKLLLEWGKYKMRPTYTQPAHWDSALALFRRAERISARISNPKWWEESQSLSGTAYLLKGDWPSGKACFRRVIEARRREADRAGELRAWLRMATPAFCDDCQENLQALSRALALSRQIDDQPREVLILLEMGYKHLNQGNIEQAEREAMQALTIQKRIGYPALCHPYHGLANQSVYNLPSDWGYLSNAYYLLSDLSQVRGDLNQKLFYILEIVSSVERSGMQTELDYAYYRLGNAYWELGQFDKSLAYHRQSLAISHAKGDLYVQFGLVRRMAIALLKTQKAKAALEMLQNIAQQNLPFTYEDKMFLAQSLGACYNATGQYNQAEKHYRESVAWSEYSTLFLQCNAWKGISQFYVDTRQYANAAPYVKRLLATSNEQLIPSHRIDVYLMQFKIDSARGNLTSAIRYYQRYKTLSDSVFSEKKSEQIARLSIQYETGKKEQALKLREKDIALLREQSKVQQTQRNVLIGGTSLLLVLLTLSYQRYRQHQRSNILLKAQQQKLQAQHEELQAQQEVLQAQQLEIYRKNEHLSKLLTEKDRLLKEIHHRVKNNLQIVMSLLNSQARHLSDNSALSAIQESQHRVQSMALIHQKLYQSEGVARISMDAYLKEVMVYLSDSYPLAHSLTFHLSVEPIELDVTLAVPVGLIVNEAITNAIKYAFPGECPGTVSLSLHRLQEKSYSLSIADDGVGLPEGYDPAHSRSLGMTLMHGFSEQLGGELTIQSGPGLSVTLVFKEEQLVNGWA